MLKKIGTMLLAAVLLVACGPGGSSSSSQPQAAASSSVAAAGAPSLFDGLDDPERAAQIAERMQGMTDYLVVMGPDYIHFDARRARMLREHDPETMPGQEVLQLLDYDEYLLVPLEDIETELETALQMAKGEYSWQNFWKQDPLYSMYVVRQNSSITGFDNLVYPLDISGDVPPGYLDILDGILQKGVRVTRHKMKADNSGEDFDAVWGTLNAQPGLVPCYPLYDYNNGTNHYADGIYNACPYIDVEYTYQNHEGVYNQLSFLGGYGRVDRLGDYTCDDVFIPLIGYLEEQGYLRAHSGARGYSVQGSGTSLKLERSMTLYLKGALPEEVARQAETLWQQAATSYPYAEPFHFSYNPIESYPVDIYAVGQPNLEGLRAAGVTEWGDDDSVPYRGQRVPLYEELNQLDVPPEGVDAEALAAASIALPGHYYSSTIYYARYIRSGDVQLYSGPGYGYAPAALLPAETPFYRLGCQPLGVQPWELVEYDGGYGWMLYDEEEMTEAEIEPVVLPAKPVIYLYPQQQTEVSVQVHFRQGHFTCTYPDYGDGWQVTAWPDGRIVNGADGREYSYLYWEGAMDADFDMSRGFVVPGADTAQFLQGALAALGLTPREYNEFIVYWLPRMQNNSYNLITFQQQAYTDEAVLEIEPRPDSMLRVFMVYQPLASYMEIEPQVLEGFEREGFCVVEWGGTELGAQSVH